MGIVNIVEYTTALANVIVTLKRVQIVQGMYPTYRPCPFFGKIWMNVWAALTAIYITIM